MDTQSEEALPFVFETLDGGPLTESPISAVEWRNGRFIIDSENVTGHTGAQTRLTNAFVLGMLGLNSTRVAELTETRSATVHTRQHKMREQLGARLLPHAVTLAVRSGMVQLERSGDRKTELTEHERGMLMLSTAGLAYEEIATYLGTSPRAILLSQKQLRDKLGVSTTAGTAAVTYLDGQLNLLEAPVFQPVYLRGQQQPFHIQTEDNGPLHASPYERILWHHGILGINTKDRLTMEHGQVLALDALGLTNAESGEILHCSASAVKGRNEKLFQALGAKNRYDANRIGFEEKLLLVELPVGDDPRLTPQQKNILQLIEGSLTAPEISRKASYYIRHVERLKTQACQTLDVPNALAAITLRRMMQSGARAA